ncbi:hypothetical protein B0H11DRAFT_2292954 [Mycena galericulata]|nr:hypothetical protein B0H11DRAFT_2292954 [Mycena galericulata]
MFLTPDAPNTLRQWFSDEVILEILQHLTDTELLSLTCVSKHIHELALLSYLGRYGITENDISTHSFPPLSTSGAFKALLIARFITGVDELRLRFDNREQLDRDVRGLINLVQRLPPIRSIDLEFPPRLSRAERAAINHGDLEGMVLSVTSASRSRLSVVISPLPVSIIRPSRAVYRWFSVIGALWSDRKGPLIGDQDFREKMLIFPLMRVGGVIPSISIRAFDAPNPIGTLIVLQASGVFSLRFPSNLRLSNLEMSAIFENIQLPLLQSVEAALSTISASSLLTFLRRHPTLRQLRLPGPPHHGKALNSSTKTQRDPLPPDALPQLENVFGGMNLVAWVLASAHPFPQFTTASIELHNSTSILDDYRNALHGIARRPALSKLTLHIGSSWCPWNAMGVGPARAPESDVPHVTDLRLWFTFGAIRNPASLAKWLRLFRGLREVALINHISSTDLAGLLGKECPGINFTSYKLGKHGSHHSVA